MKVRWFRFVGVVAILSLAAATLVVGCKAPSGSSSFPKFENPFKSFSKKPIAATTKGGTEAVAEKNSQNPRPSLGERPNISSPVGGYSTAATSTADPAQRDAVQRDARTVQENYAAVNVSAPTSTAEPYPYHAVASQSPPLQPSPYEAAYQQQYAQPYAAAAANPATTYGVPANYAPTAYGVAQTPPTTYQEPVATPSYNAPQSAPQVYDSPYGTQPAPAPYTTYPSTPSSGNPQVSPYGYR